MNAQEVGKIFLIVMFLILLVVFLITGRKRLRKRNMVGDTLLYQYLSILLVMLHKVMVLILAIRVVEFIISVKLADITFAHITLLGIVYIVYSLPIKALLVSPSAYKRYRKIVEIQESILKGGKDD